MRLCLLVALWPAALALNQSAPAFFLDHIFHKYGADGVISLEGFEHLLASLGLGRVLFQREHALSLHRVNGSFRDVHDALALHRHEHRPRRHLPPATEEESNPGPERCLSPEQLLQAYNLPPHHSLRITPEMFEDLCPAIVYELDHKACVLAHSSKDPEAPNQHSVWIWASLCITVISISGLLGVAIVPIFYKKVFQNVLHFLIGLAVGTLCADALLHLLPHALSSIATDHQATVFTTCASFATLLAFFMLESVIGCLRKPPDSKNIDKSEEILKPKIGGELGKELSPMIKSSLSFDEELMHAHHHHSHHSHHKQGNGMKNIVWMVIMGDGLHNLTDGLAIGAAFSGDIISGFATSVAVLCHELPHELGDFAVLLDAGMTVREAVIYNIISSILSFIGMAAGILIGNFVSAKLWIYAVTAGTFLYIGLVDLIPEMKHQAEESRSIIIVLLQLLGLTVGGIVMLLIALFEEDIYLLLS